jgi:hypothetical protein
LQQSGGVWSESVLYAFNGGSDGAAPVSGVTFDLTGSLYGTTFAGGNKTCAGTNGCGVFFELVHSGGKWTERVLHSFGSTTRDGWRPYGTPVRDGAAGTGNFYGVTYYGGIHGANQGDYGYGTVYEVTP